MELPQFVIAVFAGIREPIVMLSCRTLKAFSDSHLPINLDDCPSVDHNHGVEDLRAVIEFHLLSRLPFRSENKEWDRVDSLAKSDQVYLFLWAAHQGNLEILRRFNSQTVAVSSTDPRTGINALHLVSLKGNSNCVSWLLENECPIVDTKFGFSPLHFAAVGECFECCRYLFEAGCEVDDLLMHSAIQGGSANCVRYLLEIQAPLNGYNASGLSALHLSVQFNRRQIVELLIQDARLIREVKTKRKGYTALHISAVRGVSECLVFLLENGFDVEARSRKNQTPLHVACEFGQANCVRILLHYGAAIEARDCRGRTPLMCAISASPFSFQIVKDLIYHGADVNTADLQNRSALHVATWNGLEKLVNLLVKNGANVLARSAKNLTTLEVMSCRTPQCVHQLFHNLDDDIQVVNERVQFDFRHIVNHCEVGESGYLYSLEQTQKNLMIGHPVCQAFLHLKWRKVRNVILLRVILALFAVSLLSVYTLLAISRGCYDLAYSSSANKNLNNYCFDTPFHSLFIHQPFTMHVVWGLVIFFTICNVVRLVFSLSAYTCLVDYFTYKFNLLELGLTIFICLLSFRNAENGTFRWQNAIGAICVLEGWTYISILICNSSSYGVYILMFNHIIKQFLKILVAFIYIIIGFTFSFCILEQDLFNNPVSAFIQTFSMMLGGVDIDIILATLHDADSKSYNYVIDKSVAVFIFCTFMMFITIALTNMLISLTVSDVDGLLKDAENCVNDQTLSTIYFIEKCLHQKFVPRRLAQFFIEYVCLWPNTQNKTVVVDPWNCDQRILPEKIIHSAYKIVLDKAKGNVSEEKKIEGWMHTIEVEMDEMKHSLVNMNNLMKKWINGADHY